MTFYIPPVFLFGNKVRHIKHNQEKNKAEYKTATETGIQIENRNIKRIEELEKENTELKEHKENLIWLDKKKDKEIEKLEEENKKLKEDFDNYKNKVSEDMKGIVKNQTENIKLFDRIKGEYKKLEKENKRLKNRIKNWKFIRGIISDCIMLALLCLMCSWILCMFLYHLVSVLIGLTVPVYNFKYNSTSTPDCYDTSTYR